VHVQIVNLSNEFGNIYAVVQSTCGYLFMFGLRLHGLC
jgi:hypothetical protein